MAPTRPLSPNKSNGSELPNVDILNTYKLHALRVLLCTIILSSYVKIYSYSDSQKFVKPQLFIIIIIFFFLHLQFKRPTAKLGLVMALILSRKCIIVTLWLDFGIRTHNVRRPISKSVNSYDCWFFSNTSYFCKSSLQYMPCHFSTFSLDNR